MTKAELILKSIMAATDSPQAFVENYLRLITDHEVDTFKSVLEMKGLKKNEISLFVDIFKSKISTHGPPAM